MEVEVYKRWDEENQKHWWFEGSDAYNKKRETNSKNSI